MINRIIRSDHKIWIHARPAAMIAGLASKFDSVIMLMADERIADAKDVTAVLNLFPRGTEEVELLTEGSDEAQAAEKMEELLLTFQGTDTK